MTSQSAPFSLSFVRVGRRHAKIYAKIYAKLAACAKTTRVNNMDHFTRGDQDALKGEGSDISECQFCGLPLP